MPRWTLVPIAALAALALGATALIASAGGARDASFTLLDRPLFATLTGAAEVGPGDTNGRGAASLLVTGSRICFGLQVNGIDRPVAAHVHRGEAGENGPIVFSLVAPPSGTHGAISRCRVASATVRGQIRRSPSDFYVNVHTGDFPEGALRGQLRP